MTKISKKAKSQNNKKIRLLVLFSLVFLVFISTGYAILKTSLNIVATTTLNLEDSKNNQNYEITDSWYNDFRKYYNIKINVKNDKSVETTGWKISFNIPSDVESIESPNALVEISNGKVIFKNKEYNSVIQPNGSVEFSFIFKTANEEYTPTNIYQELFFYEESDTSNDESEVIENDIKKEIVLKSNWGDETQGYVMQYDIVLTNLSQHNIQNWTLSLNNAYNFEIVNIWNGNYVKKDDTIIITGLDYNSSIKSGESVNIGIQIKSNIYKYKPNIEILNSYNQSISTAKTQSQEVQIYSDLEYNFENISVTFESKEVLKQEDLYITNYNVNIKNSTLTTIKKVQIEINKIDDICVKSISDANYVLTSDKLVILCDNLYVENGKDYTFFIQIASKNKDYIPIVSYKISSN